MTEAAPLVATSAGIIGLVGITAAILFALGFFAGWLCGTSPAPTAAGDAALRDIDERRLARIKAAEQGWLI